MKKIKIIEKELYDRIGKNIKYYRLKNNLTKEKITQESLAEMTDVSTSLIGGLESQKVNQGISVPTLYKISKALNVTIDELVSERK